MAALWVGYADESRPMRDVVGVARVTGGSIPARIWHDLMAPAHGLSPVLDFPPAPDRPANVVPTTTTTAAPRVEPRRDPVHDRDAESA